MVELRNTFTEKIGEYHWINSLIFASDHGAYHYCKIVIEAEMLVSHICREEVVAKWLLMVNPS
jgi:hypothetical protein